MARLARRLGTDGGRIVIDGIIHGLRHDVKKDVMMMRPHTIEDAADVSEASSKASAPGPKPGDAAFATELE